MVIVRRPFNHDVIPGIVLAWVQNVQFRSRTLRTGDLQTIKMIAIVLFYFSAYTGSRYSKTMKKSLFEAFENEKKF